MTSSCQAGIRFLGTGAADWASGHECSETCRARCAQNRELGGRNVRRFSSIFVAPDTVIDFTGHGHDALDAYGIEREAIRNVIITHGHYDHFQPLEIMELASRLPHPLVVYGNDSVGYALDFAAHHSWDPEDGRFVPRAESSNIVFGLAAPEQSFRTATATVTPVPANHMIDKRHLIPEQQALNYVLELDGRTLFYGLDSSFVLPRTFDVLGRYVFDVAILDATFGDMQIDPATSGHLNFAMLRQTIEQFRQTNLFQDGARIVAAHLSRCYVDPHDLVVDKLSEQGITLAYDGMTV